MPHTRPQAAAPHPRAAFLYTPDLERYRYPDNSPFTTQRAGLLRALLQPMGLLAGRDVHEVPPRPATRDELLRFHEPRYLAALEAAQAGTLDSEAFLMGIGTPDCPVFPGMLDYASLAAGASLTAARLLLDGNADITFNPSGGYHHAHPARAAGFCYLNDVVLACLELTGRGKRVLFLDIDAHHCDGVQAAFYGRRDVMTLSLHETGRTLFPGSGFEEEIGAGEGHGYSINLPLPPGTYDEVYLRAFREIVPPLHRAFRPDVLVVEIGLDTLRGDPLTHLQLTNNAVAAVLEWVRSTGMPVLATGGGGYHVENTVRGWALAWRVLTGADEGNDPSIGMGGVLLESPEWQGGLRDRARLPPPPPDREAIDREIDSAVRTVKRLVFPLHGLA